MRDLRQFWTPRRIGEDRVSLARLGSLRLWLARAEKEWAFACEYAEPAEILDIAQVPEDVVPDSLAWTTAIFGNAPREFLLKPTFPDRPLVVKPPVPIHIPVGESGLFYVLIPIFISIILSSAKKEWTLGIIPSRRLSDTWFGGPTEGEFCYSLPGFCERDIEALNPLPHHLLCQLEIQNHSHDNLQFEKLCFRPQYTGIYCGDRHLWSTRVKIQHEGAFKGAHVRYLPEPPEMESNLMCLASPLRTEDHRFSRLTFSSAFGKDIIFGR